MGTRREIIKNSKVTIGCVAILIAMIVTYLYFLNMSVVQVVLRTEHIQKLQTLNTEIATLESAYIESQHVIANRIALLDGYDTNTTKVFVSRHQAGLVLRNN
jgi:hypothetical protein